MSGRRKPQQIGLRIKTAAGNGSRIMGGPGSPTNLGAGLRITTAVGSMLEVRGTGGRVPFMAVTIRYGRQPTFHSLVLVEGVLG